MKRFAACVIALLIVVSISLAYAEQQTDILTFGEYKDDIYENRYLELGCSLPGWHYCDKEELAAINFQTLDSLPEDLGESVRNSNGMVIMFAKSEDMQTNANISASYFKDAEFMSMIYGMKSIVEVLYTQTVSYMESLGRENTTVTMDSVEISGKTFYGYTVSYQWNGHRIIQRQIMFTKDDYVISVVVTADTEEEATIILQQFYVI